MRELPNWIQSYLQYSSSSEAPEKFHFWTAISVLAGAVRRRLWVDMKYFQWTANMYIIFVAPPGIIAKSTTASIGSRLLQQIEEVNFGPDAVTWQALTLALSTSREEATDPATGEILAMSPISIYSSEFGTFLDPTNREMVDVLVSLWDGQMGTWKKVTKMSGSEEIVNPWINLLACTTPAWIAGNFPQYLIGGGFTSRCVFVYGDKKRRLVAYPDDHIHSATHIKLEAALVKDLRHISTLIGQMTFSDEARAWGRLWYEKHYKEGMVSSLSEREWGGYWARKQTHIHKLAILLSVAHSDSLIISLEDLLLAEKIVTQNEADLPKVFTLIGRSREGEFNDVVYDAVHSYKMVDKPLLTRLLFSRLSLTQLEEGIRGCLAAGLIKSRIQNNTLVFYDARPNEEGQLETNAETN